MIAPSRPHGAALDAAVARAKALLLGVNPGGGGSTNPAFARLVDTFGLSPFECDLMMLCAAVEIDPEVGALCAKAAANGHATYPTFALALERLPQAHWSALAPQAPLRRWRLIETGDGPVLTATPLRIDERVLHHLAGVSLLDERLAMLLEPLDRNATVDLAPSHARIAHAVAALWSGPDEEPAIVQFCGEGADCRPVVAAAATAIGMRAAIGSASIIPRAPAELESFVRLWERETVLGVFGVLMVEADHIDENGPDDPGRTDAVARLLERLRGPVVVRTRDPMRITHRPSIVVDVGHPLPAEQREAWYGALGDSARDLDVDAVVAQFTLSLPTIKSIAARSVAGNGKAVWDACRAGLRARLETLAQRIESNVGWDDLVLPDGDLRTLQNIAAQLRQRITVYERWGFAAKSARGLGISALFTGPSGTGKTMAAEVLAATLRLDLFRIDLSAVVSKYIGETEKNLRRVFAAAQESGAILLFDEADTLFGKRSEVRDSHDRYANIEVGYLLQRMEAYRGLAILTTNAKSALDPAFMRRLRFVVHFPFPDANQRLEIWRRVFPALAPTEGLEFAVLAKLEIAGGTIRNIALNAAFLAADEQTPVRMQHVLAAARSEYAKLERHVTLAESGG